MTALEVSDPVEDGQEHPVVEPSFKKGDTPCVQSLSSGVESSHGGSIYNALRATSSTGDGAASEDQTGNNTLERVDTRMAANIAMFHSASSNRVQSRPGGGSAPDPPRCNTDEISRPPRVRLMADKLRLASTGEVTAWSLPNGLSDFHEEERSSPADSPNNAEHSSAIVAVSSPKWPENIKSPVSPALPRYPPPARSPTPPGLPTFGTEEARSYDFRIGAQHPIPDRNVSLLRRLLQRASPSPSPPHEDRQPRTRVFAEDGTAILGSFPQRQSGHGTNALRKADDHPFHQGNSPLAQSDGTSAGANDAASEVSGHIDADPSPDSAADEATLRWLCASAPNAPVPQLPAVPSGTPNSILLSPGSPGKRADSYHTCVSRIQESNAASRIVRQGNSILPYLAPTQSDVPINSQETNNSETNSHDSDPPRFWELLMKRAKSFFCSCCRSEDVSKALNPSEVTNQSPMNTATQDTYLTARDQVSNESQQRRSTTTIHINLRP
ncbi:hypothetical protein BJX76DRAFT_197622 [Aspergillus varians]